MTTPVDDGQRKTLAQLLRDDQQNYMERAERLRAEVAAEERHQERRRALIAEYEERAVECMVAANLIEDRGLTVGRASDGSVLVSVDPLPGDGQQAVVQ